MSKFSFVKKGNIKDGRFFLEKDESHHLINVLRQKVNTSIWLTDGRGGTYLSKIDNIKNSKIVEGEILESFSNQNELEHNIHIGLPIIKNSRMKIAIEKSVESGVKKISPLNLDRSIKSTVSIDKLESTMRSAVKQSMRSFIPYINTAQKLEDWYDSSSLNIVAMIDSKDSLSSFKSEILQAVKDGKEISVLIGPEGGFSSKEKEFIYDHKFIKVSVAKAILRAETATVSTLSILNEIIASYE